MAGMPCTFIRLAGCPLRCHYCDTPQAIPVGSGETMSIADILAVVEAHGRPLVLVTGGEPLAQKRCIDLLQALVARPCIVQLETSGAYLMDQVPAAVHRIVDMKSPDSGEVERNRIENLALLRACDEVKFVLCSRSDYEWAKDFIRRHALEASPATLLFSPAYGELEAAALCAWILQDRLQVRMQLQLHKYIWDAEATGV